MTHWRSMRTRQNRTSSLHLEVLFALLSRAARGAGLTESVSCHSQEHLILLSPPLSSPPFSFIILSSSLLHPHPLSSILSSLSSTPLSSILSSLSSPVSIVYMPTCLQVFSVISVVSAVAFTDPPLLPAPLSLQLHGEVSRVGGAAGFI